MIGNVESIIKWLVHQELDKIFEIKEKKEKRSLSQNAYAWKLITEIANHERVSKEFVYMTMLEDYGQSEIVSMVSSINPEGYFKYYKELGKSALNNKEFTHYKIFKGSSEFDTKEMTIFLNGIINECEQLGIPTLTDEQIKEMRLI